MPPDGLSFDDLVPKAPQQSGPLSFDDLVPKADAQQQGTPSEPRDTGWTGALTAGLAQAAKGIKSTAESTTGAPEATPPPDIAAAQPVTWGDFLRPSTLGKKLVYGLAQSSPAIAGAVGGGALGSAVEPGVGTVIGAGAGAAIGDMLQTFGPQFADALKETPNDPNSAFDRALSKTVMSGAFSGVSQAAFGFAPFKSTFKDLAFQAFGVQPAIQEGEHVLQNIAEGKPATEGLGQAYPGAVASTAVPMAAHAAIGRVARSGDEATPTAAAATPETQAPSPGVQMAPDPGTGIAPQRGVQGLNDPLGDLVRDGEAQPLRPSQRLPATESRNLGPLSEAAEGKSAIPPVSAPDQAQARQQGATIQSAPPVSFTTSKGSVYQVNPDGTTTRNKSFHPEHGPQDVGVQPQSEATFYATADEAKALAEFQTNGNSKRSIAPLGDGRWGLRYDSGANAGKFEARTVVTPETGPRVGLIPIEVWDAGSRAHFGNEISNVIPAGTPDLTASVALERPIGAVSRGTTTSSDGEPRLTAADRPISLAEFLARNGGVRDETGELVSMDADQWHRGKPFMPRLVKPDGMAPGDAAVLAQQRGYFPADDPRQPPQIDQNDLYEALDAELHGRPLYAEQDRDLVERQQQRAQTERENDPAYRDHLIYGLQQDAESLGIGHEGLSPEELLAEVTERKALMQEPRTAEARETAADELEDFADAWLHGVNPGMLEGLRDADRADTKAVPESPQIGGVPADRGGPEAVPAGPESRTGVGEAATGRGEAASERTPEGDQLVIPGAERSAVQAAASREATGRGLQSTRPQTDPGGMFESTTEPETGLFEPKPYQPPVLDRDSRGRPLQREPLVPQGADKVIGEIERRTPVGERPLEGVPPQEGQYHDRASDSLAEAAVASGGQGARGTPVEERAMRAIAHAGAAKIKNLNPVERFSIFPRTLAQLDTMTARLMDAWGRRTAEGNGNIEKLRQVMSPTFLKLDDASKQRVYAALELGRIWDWRPADDGRLVRVRNTSAWYARKSKVGDDFTLSDRETAALHELIRLGDAEWDMRMAAMARREGWTGVPDAGLVAEAARNATSRPEQRKLERLSELLGLMQRQKQNVYFPAMRNGSHFLMVTPKAGVDKESPGGYPEVKWFETVERPALNDILGISDKPGAVPNRVAERVMALNDLRDASGNQPFGEIRAVPRGGKTIFESDTHRVETGDIYRRPDILRRLDIPAVEKLLMLMEGKVKADLAQKALQRSGAEDEDSAPRSGAAASRQAKTEAKEDYARLYDGLIETFRDKMFEEMKAGFAKQAKLVPGYSDDFSRSIAAHVYHISRNSADLVHRDGIERAYQDLQDYHPHEAVRTYWRDWRAAQENPETPLAHAAGTLAQAGFTYALALNPSSTMVIAAHSPMMAAPVLSAGAGMRTAAAAISRALGESYGQLSFDKNKGAFIDTAKLGRTPAEKSYLAGLSQDGLLHSMGADDIRGLNDKQSELWGGLKSRMGRALDIASSNISAVDQANRASIALAAYRMAQNPRTMEAMARPLAEHNELFRQMAATDGVTPETMGRFMLSEAMGQWGTENKAPVMRGPLGTLAFTLHGFQSRYLSTAFRLMKNMGPEGRVAAGWMMAALAVGAGFNGLPFTQDMENVGDALYKRIAGRDPMIDAHLRGWLEDAGMSKAGADIVMNGPTASLLGVDLAGRIGFGDVISREASATNILGTVPSILFGRLSAAMDRYQSGQGVPAAAAELLPSGLRNPARAVLESGQGQRSRSGTMETKPDDIAQGDLIRQALGFRPLSQEQAYQRQDYTYRLKADAKADATTVEKNAASMLFDARQAEISGDTERADSLRDQVRAYIAANPDAGVTPQALRSAFRRMLAPGQAVPKRLRSQVEASPYP